AAFAAMPWRQAILPVEFDDPSEHGVLLGLAFLNLQLPVLYRVPAYEKWLLAQDLTPGYEYLAKVLKLLQSQQRGDWWNLKLPPDLFALESIESVFPRPTYVWTHRDPVETISSVCSMCAALREKQCKAAVDEAEIGPAQLDFQSEAVAR